MAKRSQVSGERNGQHRAGPGRQQLFAGPLEADRRQRSLRHCGAYLDEALGTRVGEPGDGAEDGPLGQDGGGDGLPFGI